MYFYNTAGHTNIIPRGLGIIIQYILLDNSETTSYRSI